MQLYNCKVMLGGSRYNEARRFGVTIPEIMVLRVIHGTGADDSEVVVDITASRDGAERLDKETLIRAEPGADRETTIPWNDKAERERLERRYNRALSKKKSPAEQNIKMIFGTGPLPTTLDGVGPALAQTDEPIRRTRVGRPQVYTPTSSEGQPSPEAA